jgi:cation-transporting ATPase E
LPDELAPLGLVGLADAVRTDAADTLASFTRAGIQLKILSGDHPETVAAVSGQAGFEAGHPPVSGLDLASVDPIRLGQVAE